MSARDRLRDARDEAARQASGADDDDDDRGPRTEGGEPSIPRSGGTSGGDAPPSNVPDADGDGVTDPGYVSPDSDNDDDDDDDRPSTGSSGDGPGRDAPSGGAGPTDEQREARERFEELDPTDPDSPGGTTVGNQEAEAYFAAAREAGVSIDDLDEKGSLAAQFENLTGIDPRTVAANEGGVDDVSVSFGAEAGQLTATTSGSSERQRRQRALEEEDASERAERRAAVNRYGQRQLQRLRSRGDRRASVTRFGQQQLDRFRSRGDRSAAVTRFGQRQLDALTADTAEVNPNIEGGDVSLFANQAARERELDTDFDFGDAASDPVGFLRGAGPQREAEFLNTVTGGALAAGREAEDEFRAAVTPGAGVITQQDVAQSLQSEMNDRREGLSTAAALGVAAPEPASTAAGAITLGLLGAAAASQTTEIDTPGQPFAERGELDTPTDAEVTPTEIVVPEGTTTVSPSELGIPDEAFQADESGEIPVDISGPGRITEDGDIEVPIEATQVAAGTRLDEDEEEEEAEDDEEEDGEEERITVEVPEEFIPEETVVIGGESERSEEATQPELVAEETAEEEQEGEEEDTSIDEFFRQGSGSEAVDPEDTQADEEFFEIPQRRVTSPSVDAVGGAGGLLPGFDTVSSTSPPAFDVFGGLGERTESETTIDVDADFGLGTPGQPAGTAPEFSVPDLSAPFAGPGAAATPAQAPRQTAQQVPQQTSLNVPALGTSFESFGELTTPEETVNEFIEEPTQPRPATPTQGPPDLELRRPRTSIDTGSFFAEDERAPTDSRQGGGDFLAPGFLTETVEDFTFFGFAGGRSPGQEALAAADPSLFDTGELPTAALVAGGERAEEIEETAEFFAFDEVDLS